MNLKDVLKNSSNSDSEYRQRIDFYEYSASAPLQEEVLEGQNPLEHSTYFDDVIHKQSDYFSYSKGKSTMEEVTYIMTENPERDEYLELGLESFDIFDD